MIHLGIKTKQLVLGMITGFSLAMFFPTGLASAKNGQAVVDPLVAAMPVVVAIAVSLSAVIASLSFYLGIIGLRNNIPESLLQMISSAIASAGGVLIVLANGLSNSQALNTVFIVASIVNIPIFLTSFAWISASYIHNFLNSRK